MKINNDGSTLEEILNIVEEVYNKSKTDRSAKIIIETAKKKWEFNERR